MAKTMRDLFPSLRLREDILDEIRSSEKMYETYCGWDEEAQEDFLDICSGVRGTRLLYDGFFKSIMDPENTPERLDSFLSAIMGQQVHIVRVLPADNSRITDESSLVIMDIVVELSDGSYADVEMQRIGYKFPGQRSACYSADLLLRQYQRVRSERRKEFSYRDIKRTYTIVLFKDSPAEFRAFEHVYKHHFKQHSDTGLELNLLQEYTFISLDNFMKIHKNVDNDTLLDAWLAFFTEETPERIEELLESHPEFRSLYEDAYTICENVGRVMDMFSKELQILDRNTVNLMIDEMKEEVNALREKRDILQGENDVLQEQNDTLQEKNDTLQEKNNTLQEKNDTLQEKNNTLQEQNDTLQEQNDTLQEKNDTLQEKNDTLQAEIDRLRAELVAVKSVEQ